MAYFTSNPDDLFFGEERMATIIREALRYADSDLEAKLHDVIHEACISNPEFDDWRDYATISVANAIGWHIPDYTDTGVILALVNWLEEAFTIRGLAENKDDIAIGNFAAEILRAALTPRPFGVSRLKQPEADWFQYSFIDTDDDTGEMNQFELTRAEALAYMKSWGKSHELIVTMKTPENCNANDIIDDFTYENGVLKMKNNDNDIELPF